VTSASRIIQTDTSSVGLVIDSQTIQETPLNGHISLIGLIALAPGVQAAGTQDQVPVFGITPAIGTGGRNSYGGVGFSLDGIQTKSGTLQRGLAETASLDAIGEFKTITTGAPAEFNQPAQIVVVTQSGGKYPSRRRLRIQPWTRHICEAIFRRRPGASALPAQRVRSQFLRAHHSSASL
jgi:hypothetical protein